MNSRTLIPSEELVRLEEVENSARATTLSMKECVSRFAETSTGNSAVVVSNIHSLWEKIVGSDVAQHVHARHVKDGILYVGADHPAWGIQLKYMQENIIEQLNQAMPDEKISSVQMSVTRV